MKIGEKFKFKFEFEFKFKIVYTYNWGTHVHCISYAPRTARPVLLAYKMFEHKLPKICECDRI